MEITEPNYHDKIIVVNSRTNPKRIHTILFREVMMAIGYSFKVAQELSQRTFRHFFRARESLEEVLVEKDEFSEYLNKLHQIYKLETVKKLKVYFFAITRLRLRRQGLVILIGGASGSGKSSTTSILAGRLHMKEMSSDNIRHIMRNFISKAESPFIYTSTYDSYHLIKDESKSIEERTIEAYLRQCREVQRELKKVLDTYYSSGVWVIVEGVHITPDFIIDCMKSYQSCFGCVLFVEDPEKYKNRFASRSTKNSISPADNKYIQSFDKILMIQDYMVREANNLKIPAIHNLNFDASVSLIHRSFLANFKIMSRNKTLISDDAKNAELFHSEFLKTKAVVNKALKIKEYIKLGINSSSGSELAPNSLSLKKSVSVEANEAIEVFLDKISLLKPVNPESKKGILLVSKNAPKSMVQAVQKLIRTQPSDTLVKIHWVETSTRNFVFKTDKRHLNSHFLFDYVLLPHELLEKVVTDAESEEQIFKQALATQRLRESETNTEKVKSIIKGAGLENHQNNKFKEDRKEQPVGKLPDRLFVLKTTIASDENTNENSLGGITSESDTMNREVTSL